MVRSPRSRSGSRSSRVKSVKPDPRAWKSALDAADGDARRLRFGRETGIIYVDNRPRPTDPNASKWVQ